MTEPPPLSPLPPRFSKRIWIGPVYGHGNAPLMEGEPLTIYVEAIRSRYQEDWQSEQEAWQRRRSFMSNCYSVVEPEGELGFTPLSEVVEITEAEFRGALAGLRNWPHRRDG